MYSFNPNTRSPNAFWIQNIYNIRQWQNEEAIWIGQKWQLKSSFAGFKLFSARQIRIGSGHSLFSFVGENLIRVSTRSEGNECQNFQWISYHYKHIHSAGQVIINISIKSIFLNLLSSFILRHLYFLIFK